MELSGSIFLSTIAILGITFATMSAIVVALRHTTGEPLLPFQMFQTRLYIETGFLVAGFSVLPLMLADFGMPHALVWRVSSVALAVLLMERLVSIPIRRNRSTKLATPLQHYVTGSLRVLLAVLLVCNAAGAPFAPGPGPYELALMFKLGNRCLYLTFRLKSFLQGTA